MEENEEEIREEIIGGKSPVEREDGNKKVESEERTRNVENVGAENVEDDEMRTKSQKVEEVVPSNVKMTGKVGNEGENGVSKSESSKKQLLRNIADKLSDGKSQTACDDSDDDNEFRTNEGSEVSGEKMEIKAKSGDIIQTLGRENEEPGDNVKGEKTKEEAPHEEEIPGPIKASGGKMPSKKKKAEDPGTKVVPAHAVKQVEIKELIDEQTDVLKITADGTASGNDSGIECNVDGSGDAQDKKLISELWEDPKTEVTNLSPNSDAQEDVSLMNHATKMCLLLL